MRHSEFTCLNIGSFVDVVTLPQWLNIDILPLGNALQGKANFLQQDIREGIPFPDNSIEYVRASHVLEHLTIEEAHPFLKEIHRVLKPNGLVRIAVPDTDLIIDKYLKCDMAYFDSIQPMEYQQSKTRCEKLSRLLYSGDYSHRVAYNWGMLANYLERAGFNDILKLKAGESHKVKYLQGVPDQHTEISLYMEGIK
jgi:predicted SAM-dependent methyltransferase